MDKEKRNAAQVRYYHRHIEEQRAVHLARNRRLLREKRAWLQAYKQTLKCSVCGESDPICLDFHHVIGHGKAGIGGGSMAWFIGRNHSMAKIKAEIEKCIVLCANCHRKLHRDSKKGVKH
jgi:L-lactate utilization protein LutB